MGIGSARLCGGSRQTGSIYLETPLGEGGKPVEFFLLDPPSPLSEKMRAALPKRGVMPIRDPNSGIVHLLDWIGGDYPNVADDIEEVRRIGRSRIVAPSKELLSQLTPQSRHLAVHPRAVIKEPDLARHYLDLPRDTMQCPKCRKEHEVERGGHAGETCVGLYWYDVREGAIPVMEHMRPAIRDLPCGTYDCWIPPEITHGQDRHYAPGIYMSLPIHNLAVVEGSGAEEKLEIASVSGLQVRLASE